MSSLSLICPESGVAPLVDRGTDLENELPTPSASPVTVDRWASPRPEQVLDSLLAARPVGCVIENVLDWKPLRNPATSYTLDSRPMEGITNLERSALGGIPGQ